MTAIILGCASPIIVGVFLFYFKRSQDKKDKQNDENVEARRKESLLSLDMTLAAADLSYAVAVAYKRGYANGEVEIGVATYQKAKDSYRKFMDEQATKSLVT